MRPIFFGNDKTLKNCDTLQLTPSTIRHWNIKQLCQITVHAFFNVANIRQTGIYAKIDQNIWDVSVLKIK